TGRGYHKAGRQDQARRRRALVRQRDGQHSKARAMLADGNGVELDALAAEVAHDLVQLAAVLVGEVVRHKSVGDAPVALAVQQADAENLVFEIDHAPRSW